MFTVEVHSLPIWKVVPSYYSEESHFLTISAREREEKCRTTPAMLCLSHTFCFVYFVLLSITRLWRSSYRHLAIAKESSP
ncbi:hypothetical protein BDV27DRAFT_125451 [Aspergillus caelatus]|uniref:Uncharacterized protein n=1 Tax=Aspergillus caelatus TaxID=61420 RepID=A0A5N7A8Y9_9EURO|nr:uncharacterized protein BDV27DRAFT_125451 [Aspergillus caelatus]KAE8366302.1 hypothetical protein BDV27DRAFT_125451 [Aspergillus caelatus]